MAVDMSRITGPYIQKCPECKYCIFEDILFPQYKQSSILEMRVPSNREHMHRELIEQLCGENRDDVCDMKYAAMRAAMNEYQAAQFGAVKALIWDLGKERNRRVTYDEALSSWNEPKDLGRGLKESYAERFREVWNLGTRVNDWGEKRQIIKPEAIYEHVAAIGTDYDLHILSLKKLKEAHLKRDSIGKIRKAV